MATTATGTEEPTLAVFRLSPVAAGTVEDVPKVILDQRPFLRQNAVWFCRLRWIVVAVLAATALAACFPQVLAAGGLALRPGWPLGVALALAACNLLYLRLLSARGQEHGRSARQLWLQIAVDLVLLTVVVHYVGSTQTYAPFAYLFHIILSCMFLSARESLAVTVSAAVLYLCCVAAEWAGVWPATTVLGSPAAGPAALSPHRLALHIASLLAIWVVIWYLVSRLARRLHEGERELAVANARLKASVEERMRHMLQTTHQLKAPFAAIHAQTQLLAEGLRGPLPEEALRVIQRIADRSKMLSQQIHDMLQLANLQSRSQTPAARQEIDLAALVESAAARLAPAASLRGITIAIESMPAPVWARKTTCACSLTTSSPTR